MRQKNFGLSSQCFIRVMSGQGLNSGLSLHYRRKWLLRAVDVLGARSAEKTASSQVNEQLQNAGIV
jgi:hypothetical protein